MAPAAPTQSVIRGDQTGFRDRIPILEKLSPGYYAEEKEKISAAPGSQSRTPPTCPRKAATGWSKSRPSRPPS